MSASLESSQTAIPLGHGGALTEGEVSAAVHGVSEIPMNPKVRMHRSFSDWVVDIAIWTIVALAVAAILYPLWFIVIASFSDPKLVASGQITFIPRGITLKGYATIFHDARIWRGYENTLLYTFAGTLLNMVVTIPVAFALSRREFRARHLIMFLFTFTMFFGGGLIPSYLLYRQLGILNSAWVFILPGAVSVYNVIIARSFFDTSLPEELFDAAHLDGMSYLGYFVRIVLPLSSAIIAVIALYYFVGHWNDYFTGLIYVTDTQKWPLQNVLQQILLANQTQTSTAASGAQEAKEIAEQIKYGVIIVSTLPLLVMYPFLQRYFNKGVMIGAVKG